MEVVTRLDGAVALGLERLIDLGYFKTRSEAIRAAVLKLTSEFHVLDSPAEVENKLLAVEKMKRIEADVKAGKIKMLSSTEALSKYRKELGLKS